MASVTLSATDAIGHSTETIAILIAVAGWLAVGALRGYDRDLLLQPMRQVWRAASGSLAAIVFAVLLMRPLLDTSVGWFWMLVALAPIPPVAAVTRLAAARLMARDPARRLAPRVVIVGGGERAHRFTAALRGQPRLRLLGIVDDTSAEWSPAWLPACYDVDALRHLGPIETLFDLIRAGRVDQVIVALPWSAERRVLALVRRLGDYPVHVRMAPELVAYRFAGSGRTRLGGVDLMHVAERPIAGWRSVAKRGVDLAVTIPALIVCAFPIVAIAVAIKLDSPGPVLFRQRRIGFNDRAFTILKFRTMRLGPDATETIVQANRHDPRVTRTGRLLRRTSLDELPQFLNVLAGDMAVVGPRPHAPGTPAGQRPFEEVIARYAARHRVRPGITGLAQVRGHRGETATEAQLERRVESDLEYIEGWSFWRDLVILFQTVGTVLSMRNAH